MAKFPRSRKDAPDRAREAGLGGFGGSSRGGSRHASASSPVFPIYDWSRPPPKATGSVEDLIANSSRASRVQSPRRFLSIDGPIPPCARPDRSDEGSLKLNRRKLSASESRSCAPSERSPGQASITVFAAASMKNALDAADTARTGVKFYARPAMAPTVALHDFISRKLLGI